MPKSAPLVTVPNVELLEVGIDWETSTGTFSFTADDLASAVASQADPGVRTPIIKLGHVDPRFDGQPALGRIINPRLTNNDQTLVGDLAGMPAWLAEVLPSAYPRRSIEGWFDYRTRTGNVWPFILTGVALLGTAYPAIQTLEDLELLWGEEPPVLIEYDEDGEPIAAGIPIAATQLGEDDHMPKWSLRRAKPGANAETTGAPETVTIRVPDAESGQNTGVSGAAAGAVEAIEVRASTTVSDLIKAFYEEYDEPAMMWWWVREVLVNPGELIVDMDGDGLLRVPYTISSDDTVTFGEGEEVKIEYVAAANQRVAASYSEPTSTGRKKRVSAETVEPSATVPRDAGDPQEERDVQLSPEALARLGLGPDATDEQINAAIEERTTPAPDDGSTEAAGDTPTQPAPTEQPVPAPAPVPVPDTQGTPAAAPDTQPATQPPATPEAPATAPAVNVPDGMVLVDAAAMAEVQQEVNLSRQERQRRATEDRDRTIKAGVAAGKFPRSRMAHFTNLWNVDPEGTRALIDQLADNVIPVAERGLVGGEVEAAEGSQDYPPAWKTHVAAATRNTGSRVKVVD